MPDRDGLTKEQKQIAKLNAAKAKRIAQGDAGANYDINLLPTKYSGDDIVDNPNVGGLQPGRPWI